MSKNRQSHSKSDPPLKRKPIAEDSPDSRGSSSKKRKAKESRVQFASPAVSQIYYHENVDRKETIIEKDISEDDDGDDNDEFLEFSKQRSKNTLRNADDMDSESEEEGSDTLDADTYENEDVQRKGDVDDDDQDDQDYEGGEEEKGEDDTSQSEDEEKEIKVVPFNMREELEEGDFDASGTYVLKPKDKFAHHDNWLTGISKKEIKLAAKAHHSRIEVDETPIEPIEDLLKRILAIMRPKETITNTLARLHRGCKSDKGVKSTEKSSELKKEIESVTEITDHLLASGRHDIYAETYEDLLGDLRDQGLVPRDWQPITWYFQWTHQPDFHGPFTTSDMVNWVNEGYFESGITLRQYRNGIAFGEEEFFKGEEILNVLN